MVKFQVPNYNTFRDMNYFLLSLVKSRQTTDRRKATHMSPLCNLHKWAQKYTASSKMKMTYRTFRLYYFPDSCWCSTLCFSAHHADILRCTARIIIECFALFAKCSHENWMIFQRNQNLWQITCIVEVHLLC